MAFVDIDVPAQSQIVHVTRPDGSSTVSVPAEAFEAAIDKYNLSMACLSTPKLREYFAATTPMMPFPVAWKNHKAESHD